MSLDTKDVKKIREVFQDEINPLRDEVSALREQIQQLTTTLDNFLKRLTDFEDEFAIVKAEVRKLKTVVKEKLGVDI